jgi:hypothetical protein
MLAFDSFVARASCALAAVALVHLPCSASVIVVDAAGGGQHTQITAAVAAAAPGDVLLVKSGSYLPFTIDAKSLSVVADTSAVVTVTGSIRVQNLVADQTVVLSGLTTSPLLVGSSNPDPTLGAGLVVSACQGSVRAQECEFKGANAPSSSCFSNLFRGRIGAYVKNSVDVAMVRCTLRGGNGGAHAGQCWCGTDGGDGGAALLLDAGLLALYDDVAQGGKGGRGAEAGGDGGHGAWLINGIGALCSGSSFLGGDGGIADANTNDPGGLCLFGQGGAGGDGFRIETYGDVLSAAQLVGGVYGGGTGGIPFNGPQGVHGGATTGPNTFVLQGPERVMAAPAVAREGTPIPITIHGVPGDQVSIRFSYATGFRPITAWKGVLITLRNGMTPVLLVGTLPASGTLTTSIPAPAVDASVGASTLFLQAQITNPQGTWLGSYAATTVLDSAY